VYPPEPPDTGTKPMRNLVIASVFSLFALTSVQAEAPIHGTMEAFVVELQDQKESLVAASDVEPNELVEYQLTYVNKGDANINGLTVVGPVPTGTMYVSDTATADVDAELLVSIDGGKTFEAEPVIRTETKDNGEVVEVVIPPEQYTHLRWKAGSAITADGGTQFYTYRVRVK